MAFFAALSLRVAVCTAVLGSCLCSAVPAIAQAAAGVERHAADAKGASIRNAMVRLVANPASHTGTHPWRNTLLADSVRRFGQSGLAPAAYLAFREQSRECLPHRLLAAERNHATRSAVVFARTSQAVFGSTGFRDARELQDIRAGEVDRSPATLWSRLDSFLPDWLRW